jgi:hypothetical protein
MLLEDLIINLRKEPTLAPALRIQPRECIPLFILYPSAQEYGNADHFHVVLEQV